MNVASFNAAVLATLFLAGSAWTTPAAANSELFSEGFIPRIKIELEAAAAESLRQQPRAFVPATVCEGTNIFYQVALRLKGATGSFRPLEDKPALTLDFSRLETGRKFHGLRRIYLNNSVEDPACINEKLGSELFRAAGIPSPRVTRALVELNGRALGLYVLKEGFTEDFLARHFQKISGELYESGEGSDVDEQLERNSVAAPFDKERTALKSLASAVSESDPGKRWQKIEATLDTERFMNFMALEIMLGHRDGYCLARNNFRVYHDLDSGKMVFFPSGMDQLLGTSDLSWQPHLAGLVAQAVMNTAEGRQAFTNTFVSLFNRAFDTNKLATRVEQLVGELRPVSGRAEFKNIRAEADIIKERIVRRQEYLATQINRPAPTPLIFINDVAKVVAWEAAEMPTTGKMEHCRVDGSNTLHISTSSETLASWRSRISLPRGRYRFEGRAQTTNVEPLSIGTRQGAGLRISGGVERSLPMTGNSPWRDLEVTFDVASPMKDIELICELRARKGESWFDKDSLRIVRINDL